jgi:Myb-like DNA-binding domain
MLNFLIPNRQCRERWIYFLDPSIKTSPYTQEEDDKLWQLQKKLGNKWSQIAAQLPGRTVSVLLLLLK